MIIVELFNGTTYPIISGTRIVFGAEDVFLKSMSTDGEEVLVNIKSSEIEFISELN